MAHFPSAVKVDGRPAWRLLSASPTTGQLQVGIAESLSYEIAGINLLRTRLATATRSSCASG